MEIPLLVQEFHLERGVRNIAEDFGQRSQELRRGDVGWSKSRFNDAGRLAARTSVKLFHAAAADLPKSLRTGCGNSPTPREFPQAPHGRLPRRPQHVPPLLIPVARD
jgi:hypothetical protein